MSNSLGAPPDESLVSVARELHVGGFVFTAVVAAVFANLWLERRGRQNWEGLPPVKSANLGHPYRATIVAIAAAGKAPPLLRGAAFANIVFGNVFIPLIALAVVRYPFDGISIPLLPAMALALLNWACAWLLLTRAKLAASAARSGAVGSLMANVGLLAIAGVHFVEVELQRDGIEHACSSSVTFVVIVFAAASVAQALVVLVALRAHGETLAFKPQSIVRPEAESPWGLARAGSPQASGGRRQGAAAAPLGSAWRESATRQ